MLRTLMCLSSEWGQSFCNLPCLTSSWLFSTKFDLEAHAMCKHPPVSHLQICVTYFWFCSCPQLMGLLSQREFSMPAPAANVPAQPGQRPPCGSQPAAAAASAAAAAQAYELPYSRRPAIDWALRTRMRFCSGIPFRLCEDATQASGGRSDMQFRAHAQMHLPLNEALAALCRASTL